MSVQLNNVTDVVAAGLCTGCGLCSSIAGPDNISMGINIAGNMRPLPIRPINAAVNSEIMKTCPGATLTGPGKPDGVETDPTWGPIRQLRRTWSAEPEVRHRAAAGGTLTGLGRYLLESGEVDAILHVKASEKTPWLTDAQISRTGEAVLQGAQSRYGPAAPLKHVKALLDAGERFAVIAKPCDISAVRALAVVDPRVNKQVKYLLTNFCGGVFNAHVARSIIRYHGVDEVDVKRFGFRGDGWPGPHRVETRDGQTFDIAYEEAYKDKPWGYDLQFRCKICPDAVGEVADISVPDGWILRNGKPVYDEAPGTNAAVVRTESGARLLANAVKAGFIETSELSLAELEAMHANHPVRKLGTPATFFALKIMGQPRPDVRGYRPWMSLRHGGPRVAIRQFRGTIRRVIRRDNSEPTI